MSANANVIWLPCRIYVAPSVQRCKVWLMPTTRVPCSNAAKTQNPLKFDGVSHLSRLWAEVRHIVRTCVGDIAV